MKKSIATALLFVLAFGLCACQAAPEKEAVVSKNNALFASALTGAQETDSDGEENIQQEKTPSVVADAFTSSDNTISYTLNMAEPLPGSALPILEVTPHTITAEEAEYVAHIFFGDVELHEYSEERSKSEIEAKILEIRRNISDRDAMIKKYEDEAFVDSLIAMYESSIQRYLEQYELAPDTVNEKLCDWTFQPPSHYYDDAMYKSNDDYESYNKSEYILACASINGVPYIFNACNRNEADYRIHDIFIYVDDADPLVLYDTVEPTQKEIDKVRETAENILGKLPWGEWAADACNVEEIMETEGEKYYQIVVSASRIYEGIKTTHCEQLFNLRSDNIYAPNYYYETVTLKFAKGICVFMEIESPMDIVGIVNDNAATLPFGEIIAKLTKFLKVSNVLDGEYPMTDSMEAMVAVNSVEMGLSRISIKNNETDFYMIPTYTFYGDVVFRSEDGISSTIQAKKLATINAVDGSIINTELGY